MSTYDEEQDELLDDDDVVMAESGPPNSNVRTIAPQRRLSAAPPSNGTPLVQAPISLSDLKRASITSTSSTSSSARRSSFDPSESGGQGGLEKMHTGPGKSKKKPIPVQQWGMMNTFKIRPPTATEAVPAPAPPSIPPNQPLPAPSQSQSQESPMEEDGNFVFVPEGGSANAVSQSPPVARAVPIVVPPTTVVPQTTNPKTPRKRQKKEEPHDPNVQVFYHDATTPTTAPSQLPSTPPPVQSVTGNSPATRPPSLPNAASANDTPPTTVPVPTSTLPPIVVSQVTNSNAAVPSTPLPLKYDSLDRIFTLPEVDPLDKGGPAPKSWRPVYREIKTIGGGSWNASTWISEGEAAVPMKPPAGFKPAVNTGLYGAGVAGGLGGTGVNAAPGVTGLGSGTLGSGTGPSVLNPTASITNLAPVKQRVKKVKSDVNLGLDVPGDSGTMTPTSTTGATGPKKRGAGLTGATGVKKGRKSAGAGTGTGTGTVTPAGAATPAVVEPPLVSVSQAVSDVDSEMRDA